MLQDLILTAVNGALKMADDKTSESMSKLQGFPGLF
jgi:DNA-binding protein YbaB